MGRPMVTDPPYGVSYDPSWRAETKRANGKALSTGNVSMGEVKNDDQFDWRLAWALFPGDVCYVWHGGKFAGPVADSLEACGFEIRNQIIWVKQSLVIGRGNYHRALREKLDVGLPDGATILRKVLHDVAVGCGDCLVLSGNHVIIQVRRPGEAS
jgi:hypothetical protein